MLHEKIKQATAHLHDALEQKMYVGQIMDGSLTFEQYQTILYANYLTHLNVEEALFSGLSAKIARQLDLNSRVKLPALLKDREETNSPETYQKTRDYIDVNSDSAILGAMYVLEGATLGGNVIVKHLKTNEQLASYNLNYHYYQVYGDQLGLKWKQFLSVLNTIPEGEHDAAIQGAVRLFEHMVGLNVKVSIQTVTIRLTPPRAGL